MWGTTCVYPVRLGQLSCFHAERQTLIRVAYEFSLMLITAPESYGELVNLLCDHGEAQQLTIIERLRKCHHPSLAEGNREKLQVISNLLILYLLLPIVSGCQSHLNDLKPTHLYYLLFLSGCQ